ncbi:MAG: hypothetical protein H7144_03290, partial [Burkholderiales bacterium]|nr:hypothetical protein [Phycisphaerae bacterium]
MADKLLNEAEILLLQNWHDARQLEKTLEEVRKKYTGIFELVADRLAVLHPELDAKRLIVTQFWGSGSLGFGKKIWPEGDSQFPPGFWMDQLRLERLSDTEHPEPGLSIWIPQKAIKKIGVQHSAIGEVLLEGAKDVYSPEEIQ